MKRFDVMLNKKISTVFECETSTNKHNLISNLNISFREMINNLQKNDLFDQYGQDMSIAEQIFNYNPFLKLYFGNFDNFCLKNSVLLLKFLTEIKLLAKYCSIKEGKISNKVNDQKAEIYNIDKHINNDIKKEIHDLIFVLFKNESLAIENVMLKFVGDIVENS